MQTTPYFDWLRRGPPTYHTGGKDHLEARPKAGILTIRSKYGVLRTVPRPQKLLGELIASADGPHIFGSTASRLKMEKGPFKR